MYIPIYSENIPLFWEESDGSKLLEEKIKRKFHGLSYHRVEQVVVNEEVSHVREKEGVLMRF